MRAALLLLVLSSLARAEPPVPPAPPAPTIKLPAKVTIAAGALGKLRAETTAPRVKWVVLTPGLSVEAIDGGRTLYYSGLPGSYDLLAYTAVGDVPSDPARVTVVIGPSPAPPKPPEPPPPPDALSAKLAAAFAAASGTPEQKREWAKDLAALYRAAAKLTTDPNVTTAAMLKAKLTAAAAALIGPDALKEVRQAVAAELAAVLPAAEAELTAERRTAAAALFTKLASVLEGIAT